MQLKGRPRLALHSPTSLQLSERPAAAGPCLFGPILSLRAPATWPACRPDQLELAWQISSDGTTPTQLQVHPPEWHAPAHKDTWSLVLPLEQLLLNANRRQQAELLAHTAAAQRKLDAGCSAIAKLSEAIGSLQAMAVQGLAHEWLAHEPLLLELLVGALVASCPSQAMPRQDRGWRHVIETLRCMEQGLGEELSLADLAQATGVSARALQMAFRRHLQKRPLQSLRELRLARLRQLLLHGGLRPGMAELVRHCGLPGNGNTARYYYERYGEKPSQTRP